MTLHSFRRITNVAASPLKQDRIIDYRSSDQFSKLIDAQREIQARTQASGFVLDKNLINRKSTHSQSENRVNSALKQVTVRSRVAP
jgi:hypothetical protein